MAMRHRGWQRGDVVHVPLYGKGTIVEARNGGRYLVEIKGRSMVVAGDDITSLDVVGGARRRGQPAGGVPPPHESAERGVVASLDLHGKTAQEAVDALDSFLNEVLLRGDAHVHVIHGRSGGRVKAAVHARLKQITSVRGFRLDPRNPGMTIVGF